MEGAYLTAHGQGVAQPWRSQGAASPGGCGQEAPSYSSLLSLPGRSAPEQGLSRVLPPCTAPACLASLRTTPARAGTGSRLPGNRALLLAPRSGFRELGSEWEEPVVKFPPSVFASRTCGNQFDGSFLQDGEIYSVPGTHVP